MEKNLFPRVGAEEEVFLHEQEGDAQKEDVAQTHLVEGEEQARYYPLSVMAEKLTDQRVLYKWLKLG